jgi:F-type H+-transporting ATPase subunit delta
MHDLVRGYAAATFETAAGDGDLARLQRDLEVFLVAIEGSDQLRNTLADPSQSERTRRGVVSDLLKGRAVEEASDLAGFATRIERANDLPVVIAQLLEAANAALDAETAGWGLIEQETGGRLAVRDRIRGFADRVLSELTETSDVDTVEDELFRIARIVESSAPLRETLANPELDYAHKAAILQQIFGGKVTAPTTRLLRFVVRAGRLRDLVGMVDWLVEIAAAERGRRVAEVRSAVDLDDAEQARLSAALGRIVDRNVEVRVIIDPSVIGGAFVSVGDLVIDGTVRQRFERLRDVLEQHS